jgi:hypothetical protein
MLGKFEQAREELMAAVRARPTAGHAWIALAMAGDMADCPEIAALIEEADPALTGVSIEAPGAYYYALGKVHADRGSHAAAFAAFERGGSKMAAVTAYDPAAEESFARRVREDFSREFIAGLSASVSRATGRSIIVTGNPRSGTTLVEQILVSHSAVSNGDELGLMRIVAQDVGGVLAADINRWREAGGSTDLLAKIYLHLLDERLGAEGRVVDKTISASRSLGFLAGILPDAPLIWVRRNPVDCAWSCFRTYFEGSASWSWSLETIADHFNIEEKMLAHWREVLGARLLILDYEALVRAPHEVIPLLLAHCGLDVEPAVFEPEKTVRPIRTASVSQVRAPISRASIGAAAPYHDYMGPFFDRYSGSIDP